MGKPHVLVVPFPSQGHVIPLMELSHRLVDCGVAVTFVATEFLHRRLVADGGNAIDAGVRLASIPDGMGPEDDRNQLIKMCDAIYSFMQPYFEGLVNKINECEEDKLSLVIADKTMAPAFIVAAKLGIRIAAFCPSAMATFALNLHIPRMLQEGIIDGNGVPTKHQTFQLAPNMPELELAHSAWNTMKEHNFTCFKFIVESNEAIKQAQWILCNSFHDLEPAAFDLFPRVLPIGPLLSNHRKGKPVGQFWEEDSSSLLWLDQQLPGSVIYVAFGSSATLNREQFNELAHGLELSGRPFLWVVRADHMDGSDAAYPIGFEERVDERGKMMNWAPQQKVLAHPSVGCFISHCGWNSTTEGLSNGVPFLCWPYYADQFLNEKYICDIWKIGLKFDADEGGVFTEEEIRVKIDSLFADGGIKERVLEMKQMAEKNLGEGGNSWKNFANFVEAVI